MDVGENGDFERSLKNLKNSVNLKDRSGFNESLWH